MDSGFTIPTTALYGGFARRLVDEGSLGAERLRRVQQAAARSLLAELRMHKLVPEARLLALASVEFGLPLVDLEALEVDPEATQVVPLEQARTLRVLPLYRRGQCLFVAVDDPATDAVDRLAFHTGLTLDPVALDAALERLKEAEADPFAGLADTGLEEIEVEADRDTEVPSLPTEVNDAPVVRFVHKLMLDAVNAGASDLPFELYGGRYRVRMRVDGCCERWWNRRAPWRRASPPASRSWRAWTSPNGACPRRPCGRRGFPPKKQAPYRSSTKPKAVTVATVVTGDVPVSSRSCLSTRPCRVWCWREVGAIKWWRGLPN